MHYDISALSLWLTLGATLVLGAFQLAGWKQRLLITALIAIGALCMVAALAWPWLQESWPRLAAFMSNAATPSSWFVLLLLIITWLAFGTRFNRPTKDSEEQKGTLEKLRADVDEIFRQIRVQAPNANTVYQAFKNLDDATASKVDRVREETQRFSDRVKKLERETSRLVFFATDLSTKAVLEGYLSEGSNLNIPLAPNIDEAHRANCVEQTDRFILRVCSTFADTHRGMLIANTLREAEQVAENEIRAMPPSERPSHMDLLDYRRLLIMETRRVRLIEFLKRQTEEKVTEIRNQRPDLVELLPRN